MPTMPMPMGAPGMGDSGPGAGQMDDAFAALGNLSPKSPNPTASLQRVREALDMMEKLARAIDPQVSQMNSKVSKDLLSIRQRIMTAKADLTRDMPLAPPPDLMLGMGNAAGSAPSFGAPAVPGGVGGGATPF